MGETVSALSPRTSSRPWHRILYVQVLIAVAIGIGLGWAFPSDPEAPHRWRASSLRPLGDGFIALVKMIIAPIIFCTVVHGIAAMADLKKLGRVGGKALLYFEVVSTLALIIGLVVVNVWQPGVGMHVDPQALDPKAVAATQRYVEKAHGLSTVQFLLAIIPTSFFDAFAKGDLLQVLLVSVLTALAIAAMGERGRPVLHVIEAAAQIFFGIMGIVVKVAPLAALGAMAYTVGEHGIGALKNLLSLMLGFYVTAGVFIVVVLGLMARVCGFSIFRFIGYIREELLLVLGTSSSESALPGLLQKLRRLGCAETTVGLVVPTGYSFNLDGTNIYLSMAAVFLAQATDTPLGLGQQVSLLLIAMLTSKGASGVTGAGFITLAATLAAVPAVPIESLALLLGIDRFMSECRALTNFIGNGVATVVVSRWEREVTPEQLQAAMRRG
jgi:aerobic C4-dicarboxylate transport protein